MTGRLSAVIILLAMAAGKIFGEIGEDVRALNGGKEVRLLNFRV